MTESKIAVEFEPLDAIYLREMAARIALESERTPVVRAVFGRIDAALATAIHRDFERLGLTGESPGQGTVGDE
jgi:hypothetical protein